MASYLFVIIIATAAALTNPLIDGFPSHVTRRWGGHDHGLSLALFVTNYANCFDLRHAMILVRVCPDFTPLQAPATYKKTT